MRIQRIYNSKEEYDKDHEVCPKCYMKDMFVTCICFIFIKNKVYKNENECNCRCGWRGIVDDMIPKC